MNFSELEKITGGKIIQLAADRLVANLVIDSRKAIIDEASVFFAMAGPRNNGHDYLSTLYQLGLRQLVVEGKIDSNEFPLANILQVDSSVRALQAIAKTHRSNFTFPVVGITGSNGKTIVKEWLYQLLSPDYSIAKNPGSYNSQVGVPLSVWAMQAHHQFGIFEAGISQPNEMQQLEKIIQPTLGIFTNIGTAHDEGFKNARQKIEEKLKLFQHVNKLIYCADHVLVDDAINKLGIPKLSWGKEKNADILITQTPSGFHFSFNEKQFDLFFPFSDAASIENATHGVALMLHLGYKTETIQKRINELKPVAMRLQLKEGINQCQVIDDTYNNDLAGLQISLDFLQAQQKQKKTVILSDLLQSGMSEDALAGTIASMLSKIQVFNFIGIGQSLMKHKKYFSSIPSAQYFSSTEEFLKSFDFKSIQDEMLLVKGARVFQFEKIVQHLQRKAHGTVMEIDLGKMMHNLNYFKSKLKPGVKLMAMVKAFAYGSGSEEVANLLQYHKVNYLGVAYADEGVALRKKNISLPIMVMNPSEESFAMVLSHNLEPVIYNLKMLHALVFFLEGRDCPIHIEAETGMQRLGLSIDELPAVVEILKKNTNLHVKSVFSHLSGADEKAHDSFSGKQFAFFQKFYSQLTSSLPIKPLRHILNSAGILRLPDFQMDMVRLGIGLYGIDPTQENDKALQSVATLKTVISQIKKINKGETVGYGRMGVAERETTIATLAIGYADGFSRSFSKGKGMVSVHGQRARVIGNVCMDMTMVDITNIPAREGDEAIIFGDGLPIHEVAASIGTIAYEILTNTSERVKRVFVADGV